ncbi:citrate/2-methylcitrate synthase [Desulforhabdus amnigena]|jgi:citrate synthase|uniref:citrate synthase (unknown stereospecificity) n=1 Tax=Desulforhabdus amnigena TaxID=40218 RepID=A0A9W6FUR0_9BACT|nr:citrate/2-methylcitrate synthase [Desulforhabdus amnigena]NLJ27228.1 hypothetical protein [Deltaproteobacteria bacterium]GLI35207.1 hypothetical protein DAMNIGENAA_26400 [Desulforhabdus amnigena]
MEAELLLKNVGLRGVAVADSKIDYIDGEQGILIYRGYAIEDLAAQSSFEETLYLLLNGDLPGADNLLSFSQRLKESRDVPSLAWRPSLPCDAAYPATWNCFRPIEAYRMPVISSGSSAPTSRHQRWLGLLNSPLIKSNVDFYSGLLYSLMGIPADAMMAMFAISIAMGWVPTSSMKKFAEAEPKPILYRPEAE